jgi:hypothetical protein
MVYMSRRQRHEGILYEDVLGAENDALKRGSSMDFNRTLVYIIDNEMLHNRPSVSATRNGSWNEARVHHVFKEQRDQRDPDLKLPCTPAITTAPSISYLISVNLDIKEKRRTCR